MLAAHNQSKRRWAKLTASSWDLNGGKLTFIFVVPSVTTASGKVLPVQYKVVTALSPGAGVMAPGTLPPLTDDIKVTKSVYLKLPKDAATRNWYIYVVDDSNKYSYEWGPVFSTGS